MVREDLIASAVSFLQDPSVAASPFDKRIAFLQSKNLTQEEVDVALSRAGDGTQSSNMAPPSPAHPSQYGYQGQQMRQPTAYGNGYAPYQGGPWTQAPPEPPRRDWRDWFIMATVTSGVGYGLYVAAQRYILPLISPPTPPQLEQDKTYIDESFNKAFALIDQLATDTADLKSSEVERTEKLDSTLRDVDSVIEDLKAANARREAENKIIADQVQGLKDLVPKSLEDWKSNGDARLDELGQDIQSLKKMLENRVGRSAGISTPTASRGLPSQSTNGAEKSREHRANFGSGNDTSTPNMEAGEKTSAPAPGVTVPKRDSSSPKRSFPGNERRAAIPAWQMAAAGKSGTVASSTNGEESTSETRP